MTDSQNVIELFKKNVALFPELPAISNGENEISYHQLDLLTKELSLVLTGGGKDRGELCFVIVRDPVASVASTLGVLRSGKILVPINFDFPDEKILDLIMDFQPGWIILDKQGAQRMTSFRDVLSKSQVKLCNYDLDHQVIPDDMKGFFVSPEKTNSTNQRNEPALNESDPCYIYFTSGSTGKPKPVLGWFKALNHFINWEVDFLGLPPNPRTSQFTPFTFDPYLRDIFVPLSLGGCVCIPPIEDNTLKLEKLISWLKSERINLVHCVPTLFREIINTADSEEIMPDLLYILLAGEKLYGKDINDWSEHFGKQTQLVNLYGPTETTLAKFAYTADFSKDTDGHVPVGKAIPGAKAIILDDNMQPCKTGTTGEIYIRTDYRSLGYYNDPNLTSEKFVTHELLKDQNDVLYKTGDMAYLDENGNFVIQGRADDQVKINGMRVELGEIESFLTKHESVESAVVDYHEETKVLSAAVCTNSPLTAKLLDEFLARKVPQYLIPKFYLFLDEFPVGSNGKVDKRFLKKQLRTNSKEKHGNTSKPTGKEEEALQDIWSKALKLDKSQFGIEDDFFILGGNSLKATVAVSSIRKTFEIDLKIKSFFENSTIKSLGKIIRGNVRKKSFEKITPRADSERTPLSFSQERLWFIDRFQSTIHYHMTAPLRISGDLNVQAVEKALKGLVERHEILRTIYKQDEDGGYQCVRSADHWEMSFTDLKDHDDPKNVKELINDDAQEPFNLSTDYVLRARLIAISPTEYLLMLVLHHIAADGWSLPIFVRELEELYYSYQEDRKPDLKKLDIQYGDYALWQRNSIDGNVLDSGLAFWEAKLKGVSQLNLPTDFTRPRVQSNKGDRISFNLDRGLSEKVDRISKANGVTNFMVFLAAFKVMLRIYCNQDDICVGSVIAGRDQEEVEPLIGFFVNTLALRTNLGAIENERDPNFLDILKRVKATTLEAYEHQNVPFERIVEKIVSTRDLSRNPLIQVVFVLQNLDEEASLDINGLKIEEEPFVHKTSQFDLTFSLSAESDPISVEISYCTELFKSSSIIKMMKRFEFVLHKVLTNPSLPINAVEVLDQEEKNLLTQSFNDTSIKVPRSKNIIDLFDEQVKATPDATAFVFESSSLSYKELSERSNQVANYLLKQGVEKEELVGVCLDRSIEMPVALLGILKSGAAYLPIDPAYPGKRINYILNDSKVNLLLTSVNYNSITDQMREIVVLDSDDSDIRSASNRNPDLSIDSGQLAYVMYTSGSTGKPKGVMIEHHSLVNLLFWAKSYFNITSSDCMLQKTSFTFDVSLLELFLPVMVGCKTVIAKPGGEKDALYLQRTIENYGITIIHFVPSMMNAFLNSLEPGECQNVKTIISSGEALLSDHVELFYKKFEDKELFNLYGPTESTVEASGTKILPDFDKIQPIPIGKPIFNTQIYIMGQGLTLLPMGTVGEIYIGGIQLARGYLNNAGLTSEKFIDSPYGRLYKTGDLGKWLSDGSIQYLGRIDDQVKLRGYRVELGEVESALQSHSNVRQSAVVIKERENGEKSLIAYLVLNTTHFDREELIDHVNGVLPAYMVPTIYVQVENMPVTQSGKVDKLALAATDNAIEKTHDRTPPSNEVEKKLSDIWIHLLGVKRIGVHENFFELGGHSLLAIRLQTAIKKEFSTVIQLRAIFDLPTISKLSNYIDLLNSDSQKANDLMVFEL